MANSTAVQLDLFEVGRRPPLKCRGLHAPADKKYIFRAWAYGQNGEIIRPKPGRRAVRILVADPS